MIPLITKFLLLFLFVFLLWDDENIYQEVGNIYDCT